MLQSRSTCGMPGNRRHVDVAQPLFLVLDVPLAFEDPELRPDGRIACGSFSGKDWSSRASA